MNTSKPSDENKSDFVKKLEEKLGGPIPVDKIDEAQRNNSTGSNSLQKTRTNDSVVKIPELKKPKDENTLKNIEISDQTLKRL